MDLTYEETRALLLAEVETHRKEIEARARRSGELARSDIDIIRSYESGSPVPQELAAYRQALRDITLQPRFPNEIVWPVKPE
jgi:hypothetical protein